MTIPGNADLDVRLVKGSERKRFIIETCGPSAWLLVADGAREVLTDAAQLPRARDSMLATIDALVADGWATLSPDDPGTPSV